MIKIGLKNLNRLFNKKVIFWIIVFLFFAFLLPNVIPAEAVDVGSEYAEKTGLSGTDPRVVIARIIQIVLGFLGIIAVGLMIYGGFLWMTSNGNEQQIDKAKQTLRNAIIGLVIIISSFAIVTFVLSQIQGATGIGTPGGGAAGGGTGGVGVLGNCSIENLYPEDGQKEVPRNTSIIVTFREEVDSSTICNDGGNGRCEGEPIIADGRIKLYKTSDDPSNFLTNVVVYDTIDRKTFVFVPREYLGSASEYIWYTVNLSNDILLADGKPVFSSCRNDYAEWQFEVSNKLDLTPPQVKEGGVFPAPDNFKDSVSVSSNALRAIGSFTVVSTPDVYSPARATGVSTVAGPALALSDITIDPNCPQSGQLRMVVARDEITVELSRVDNNTLLGAGRLNAGTVDFEGLFSASISGAISAGNEWRVTIDGEIQADTITVGRDIYTFVSAGASGNQIAVGGSNNATAANIVSVINGNSDINASAAGSVVNIEAKISGANGNRIVLDSSNTSNITFSSMTGGSDRVERVQVNDKSDQPMNSVIQINFNEAVMPINVSGSADDIKDYIKIVNADPAARDAGALCDINADCKSFNCNDLNRCEGAPAENYLKGTFKLSNMYRTVEFVSDNQCGVNGCGEPIYCLPENSILRVELVPADLASCGGDCAAKNPYNSCIDDICKEDFNGNYPDSRTRNFPVSDVGAMNGVMDASFNSFDGDRNGFAEGPEAVFSDNDPIYSADDQCQSDFEKIVSAVMKKRQEAGNVLGEITGSFNSSDACAVPDSAACLAAQRLAFQAIGLTDAMRDRGGNLFIINENEDQSGIGACTPDVVTSAICGPVSIPMYFCDEGDIFVWTFFINDKMEINPPIIEDVIPDRGTSANLIDPVIATFDKLMMSSSLKTGYSVVRGETADVTHKNVNIWSLKGAVPGYWTTNSSLDVNFDGQADKTQLQINHGMLSESVTYRSQIGSGVKDIYQNCFKPSSGPDCAVTADNPSCCNGSIAATLNNNGDCQ